MKSLDQSLPVPKPAVCAKQKENNHSLLDDDDDFVDLK